MRTKRKTTEAWWIDYLEQELSSGEKINADLLLEHSQMDHKILMQYQKLRRSIEVLPLEFESLADDKAYMTNLESKITKALKQGLKTREAKTKRAPRAALSDLKQSS